MCRSSQPADPLLEVMRAAEHRVTGAADFVARMITIATRQRAHRSHHFPFASHLRAKFRAAHERHRGGADE